MEPNRESLQGYSKLNQSNQFLSQQALDEKTKTAIERYYAKLAKKANREFPEAVSNQFEEEVLYVDFSSFVARRLDFEEYKRQMDWLESVLSECEIAEVVTNTPHEYGYFTGSFDNAILFVSYLEGQGLFFAFRSKNDDSERETEELERSDIPYDVAQEIAESMGE